MAPERLVAVSYPVDGELTAVNTDVLDDTATVRFLAGLGEDAQLAGLRQASALIGWQLGRELPGRERCSGTFAGGMNFIAIELQDIPCPRRLA